MRHFFTILLLTITGQCFSSTFQLDTVDNWQIYSNKHLILSGHTSPTITNFKGTIKQKKFKDLQIQYNHCIKYNEYIYVTIDITDEQDNSIMLSIFKTRQGQRIIIDKKDLRTLPTNRPLKIKYSEDESLKPHMLTLGTLVIE